MQQSNLNITGIVSNEQIFIYDNFSNNFILVNYLLRIMILNKLLPLYLAE